jgi:hypothetical protein
MNAIDQLNIISYTKERIPNPYHKRTLPWQVYHKVRNAVVHTCRRHGPTGPMGICPISFWRRAPNILKWEHGDPDPLYYIIDDQYNDERYLYAELLDGDAFSAEWLVDITRTLDGFPDWGICLSGIPGHYLIIFAKKIMVNGPQLSNCKTVREVLRVVQELIKQTS